MSSSSNKIQAWRYKGSLPGGNLTVETTVTPKKPSTHNQNNFDSSLTPTRQTRGNLSMLGNDSTAYKSSREPHSPFQAGKRNGSFRSPTFESKLFTNLDYPEKKIDVTEYNSQNAANRSLRKSLNLTPKIGGRDIIRGFQEFYYIYYF